jgi:hypothetical protein
MVATVGLSFQIHLDAVLLVIASVLLWLRGHWKPHWGGVALGAAITVGALVPFFAEAARYPEVWPGRDGDHPLLSGLLKGWPPFKGVLYWLRYPSLSVAAPMASIDFTPAFGAGADRILAPVFRFLIEIVGTATVLFTVVATFRLLRRRGGAAAGGKAGWLLRYAVWCFVAGFAANCLSTTAVMWWHNLIYFQAALLPLLVYSERRLDGSRAAAVRRVMTAYLVLSVVVTLGMAFASEQYRHGGRDPVRVRVSRDHEMLRDLHLTERGLVRLRPRARPWPRSERFFYPTYMERYSLPLPDERDTAEPRD